MMAARSLSVMSMVVSGDVRWEDRSTRGHIHWWNKVGKIVLELHPHRTYSPPHSDGSEWNGAEMIERMRDALGQFRFEMYGRLGNGFGLYVRVPWLGSAYVGHGMTTFDSWGTLRAAPGERLGGL